MFASGSHTHIAPLPPLLLLQLVFFLFLLFLLFFCFANANICNFSSLLLAILCNLEFSVAEFFIVFDIVYSLVRCVHIYNIVMYIALDIRFVAITNNARNVFNEISGIQARWVSL